MKQKIVLLVIFLVPTIFYGMRCPNEEILLRSRRHIEGAIGYMNLALAFLELPSDDNKVMYSLINQELRSAQKYVVLCNKFPEEVDCSCRKLERLLDRTRRNYHILLMKNEFMLMQEKAGDQFGFLIKDVKDRYHLDLN